MTTACETTRPRVAIAYPRYFRFGPWWVNSYKVFLIVGLTAAVLASALAASRDGSSPLRVGLASLVCAIAGLAGARIYFLVWNWLPRMRLPDRKSVWNSRDGGWSVFGGLFAVIPVSMAMAWWLGVSTARYWDWLAAAILAGGPLVRLGCAFNGCCCGRPTTGWLGLVSHDVWYTWRRRIPVQLLEIGWWLLGGAIYLGCQAVSWPVGSEGLGVLAWYGFGRFWLEPLREVPDLIGGRWRLNRLVAAALVVVAGGALAMRLSFAS